MGSPDLRVGLVLRVCLGRLVRMESQAALVLRVRRVPQEQPVPAGLADRWEQLELLVLPGQLDPTACRARPALLVSLEQLEYLGLLEPLV